jgi:hypothetical protein
MTVERGHDNFRQPLRIAPLIAEHGIGIDVTSGNPAAEKCCGKVMPGESSLAEADMTPQVGIGNLPRVGDQDHEDE